MAADTKSSARLTCTLTLTELSQELGEGDGGVVVGLVRIANKVIQGFIYLKLNYLSSGAPKKRNKEGKGGRKGGRKKEKKRGKGDFPYWIIKCALVVSIRILVKN